MSSDSEYSNYDNLVCEVCWQGTDDDRLLICDSCDCGFHTFCIGKRKVPKTDWFCPRCNPRHGGSPPPPPDIHSNERWLFTAIQRLETRQPETYVYIDNRTNRHYSFLLLFFYLVCTVALGTMIDTILENRQEIQTWLNQLEFHNLNNYWTLLYQTSHNYWTLLYQTSHNYWTLLYQTSHNYWTLFQWDEIFPQ